mmetsp:Transcript_6691/g.14984  ORF Transcript_6691/g.14984 Transcript_6691/m.14984 type:complete len:252 (-) Transcript_6691:2618-3373(-)
MSKRESNSSSLNASRISSSVFKSSSSTVAPRFFRRALSIASVPSSPASSSSSSSSSLSARSAAVRMPASADLSPNLFKSLAAPSSTPPSPFVAPPSFFNALRTLRFFSISAASFLCCMSGGSHRPFSRKASPEEVSHMRTDPFSSRVSTQTWRFSSSLAWRNLPIHTYASNPIPSSRLHINNAWSSMSPLRISMKKVGVCQMSFFLSFLNVSSSSDHVMSRTILAMLSGELISDGGSTGVKYSQKKCVMPS